MGSAASLDPVPPRPRKSLDLLGHLCGGFEDAAGRGAHGRHPAGRARRRRIVAPETKTTPSAHRVCPRAGRGGSRRADSPGVRLHGVLRDKGGSALY